MKNTLIIAGFAAALAAAPAYSQPAGSPPPATAPAKAQGSANGAAILEAARSGDKRIMQKLTGAPVTLEGRMSRLLRESDDYLEVAVLTGPDFKLAGGRSGFEVVLRIPRSLAPDPLPQAISSSGTLTGFEPGSYPGEPNRIAFTPIITVDFLR